jgi:hypothetical protein
MVGRNTAACVVEKAEVVLRRCESLVRGFCVPPCSLREITFDSSFLLIAPSKGKRALRILAGCLMQKAHCVEIVCRRIWGEQIEYRKVGLRRRVTLFCGRLQQTERLVTILCNAFAMRIQGCEQNYRRQVPFPRCTSTTPALARDQLRILRLFAASRPTRSEQTSRLGLPPLDTNGLPVGCLLDGYFSGRH